jgi:diguanylate cyclase (GGDEF)-like protein
VILSIVFAFHMFRTRQEAHEQALTATEKARRATARADDMEQLVEFGKALVESRTYDSVRAAAVNYLPKLAPGRSVWAMVRADTHWRKLAVIGDVPVADCERASKATLDEPTRSRAENGRGITFPMIVGGQPVGVLGVTATPPPGERERIVLAAAANMLAVSLNHAELFQKAHENISRDSLTGCLNRKHALEVLDGELRRSSRSQTPVSLIIFDIDHFKRINDGYGHVCGDAVLADVGSRMNTVLRGSDVKCRYGGEEFMVLLPDTAQAGARRVAEMLRSKLQEVPVRWNAVDVPVTASFGLTTAVPGELDKEALIGRADAALYRAKQRGRNCVCPADETAALA